MSDSESKDEIELARIELAISEHNARGTFTADQNDSYNTLRNRRRKLLRRINRSADIKEKPGHA